MTFYRFWTDAKELRFYFLISALHLIRSTTAFHSIPLETLRSPRSWNNWGVSQMDRMLPARQRTDCFHVRTPFSKNTLEMWGPPGLSFRTSFVLHLYNSTRLCHQISHRISYHLNPLSAGDAFKRIHTVFPQLKFDRN